MATQKPEQVEPDISLWATDDGISLKFVRSWGARGCQTGAGVLTTLDDEHAYDTLADCVREVRRTQSENLAPIGSVFASPSTPAAAVVYLAGTLHCGRRVCGQDGPSTTLYSPIYFMMVR